MKEFELSFKNKYVRMFFIWVLPVLLLSAILFFPLPIEYHWIPHIILITAVIIFYCWVKFDKNKNKR
ncbi:hypothetical protein D8M05_05800 [Oceanobacillus bengalensis]|uniref:Uncharacterized protein n=1 Tax=Oceanobacillus bengalensis TaxID=1435466 RepID=A0A494Z3Z1_9BACI|nr:hypothetical protein [Oceanobacillus bengalensis]RKQ17176.1 hypothetical protein D8M05_05800 [Oceanobacillus bengalensis]